jgi:hypothetical protein
MVANTRFSNIESLTLTVQLFLLASPFSQVGRVRRSHRNGGVLPHFKSGGSVHPVDLNIDCSRDRNGVPDRQE